MGKIESMPKTGGPVTVLADGQNMPFGLTLQGGYVYWGTEASADGGTAGAIARAPVDGSAPAEIVLSGLASPNANQSVFAVAGEAIYFIDSGNIATVPATGGSSTVFVHGHSGIIEAFLSLVTDGSILFAVTSTEGAVGEYGWTIPIATADDIANPQLGSIGELSGLPIDEAAGDGFVYVSIGGSNMSSYWYNLGDSGTFGGMQASATNIVPWGCGFFGARDTLMSSPMIFNVDPPPENSAFFVFGFFPLAQTSPAVVLQDYGFSYNLFKNPIRDFDPAAFGVDGTFVYWTDENAGGAIGRAPIP
jgi:hypothetical protein